MLVQLLYNETDYEYFAVTNGCGCCSENISDRDRIIKELKKNYRFLKNSCDILGITFDELEN